MTSVVSVCCPHPINEIFKAQRFPYPNQCWHPMASELSMRNWTSIKINESSWQMEKRICAEDKDEIGTEKGADTRRMMLYFDVPGTKLCEYPPTMEWVCSNSVKSPPEKKAGQEGKKEKVCLRKGCWEGCITRIGEQGQWPPRNWAWDKSALDVMVWKGPVFTECRWNYRTMGRRYF